jgi:hypothetical protein
VTVANPDLAREAADLLSIADKSRSRSLGELAALASRQVPACSGATATLWRDGEPLIMAATHPDVSNLTEVELASHRGPETTALATGETAHCPDTLEEERWPEYAQAALSCGVRCSVALAYRPGPEAVTLSLFGARPRVLDPGQVPLAELLVAAADLPAGQHEGHRGRQQDHRLGTVGAGLTRCHTQTGACQRGRNSPT